MRKRRIQVRLRKILKYFSIIFSSSNDKLTEETQLDALKIINKLICEPSSSLSHVFEEKKYTIETDKYYIQIFDTSVIIQNGKFSYYIAMPEKILDRVKGLFNRMIARRDNDAKRRYNDRTSRNLKEVLLDINQNCR